MKIFVILLSFTIFFSIAYADKNPESDIPRVSTPVDSIYMTDKDGNKLSDAKLGEHVFFKLPINNPFVSTKEVDYLFFIFDDGDVVFLKHDTILLEGKTSTDVLVPWMSSDAGMLDIVLEQFHHNTDTHISPVLQSTINIQEKILSPLKQFKSGTPIDNIQCKQDLHLMLKPTEFSIPICVTQSTYYELANRGWAVVLPFTNDYDDENEN